jgi:hypothetical protein
MYLARGCAAGRPKKKRDERRRIVTQRKLKLWLPPDEKGGSDGLPQTALFKCLYCDALVVVTPPPLLMSPGQGLPPAACATNSHETCPNCGRTVSVFWDERRKIARVSADGTEAIRTPPRPDAADAG